MPSENAVPEVLFLRLADGDPERHRETLRHGGYRRYIFLAAGRGTAHFDGRSEALTPGTVLSIPAQATCEVRFDGKCDGIWLAMLEEFQTSRVIPAIPAMAAPRSPFWKIYYQVSLHREMAGATQRVARKRMLHDLLSAAARLGMGSDPAVVGYLLLVLFSPSREKLNKLKSEQTQDALPHHVAANDLVLSFRWLIEQHFREHWSSDEYGRQLGVTARRLSQACKHVTGKFPKALIHERLMREARASLVYSNKSISEIAYALGFQSAAYFSHFYKRYAGVSPRRELQRLASAPHA